MEWKYEKEFEKNIRAKEEIDYKFKDMENKLIVKKEKLKRENQLEMERIKKD